VTRPWDGLSAEQWRFFPLQGQEIFLRQNVQTGSGVHSASYSIRTGINRPGHEDDKSPFLQSEGERVVAQDETFYAQLL
jgi:hypothetical protein